MNLKLEVKRLNNEDVIATSTCHVPATYHWKVNVYNAGSAYDIFEKYTYDTATGKLIFVKTEYLDDVDAYNIDSTGWWYSDTGVAGSWVKCTDQSEEAHPVKPN